METTRLVEDCLGDFGFRVIWDYSSNWCNVAVYEITGRAVTYNSPLFNRKNAQFLPDPVDRIEDAEVYLEGYIKWDGCSELDQGRPHWCGPTDYQRHIALLEWLYKRAQNLMEAGNWEPWED